MDENTQIVIDSLREIRRTRDRKLEAIYNLLFCNMFLLAILIMDIKHAPTWAYFTILPVVGAFIIIPLNKSFYNDK